MDNVLVFIPKNCSNVLSIQKAKKPQAKQSYQKLKKYNSELEEALAIKEDMIANTQLAKPEEIEHVCDDGFVITKNSEVKWNPALKDQYDYVMSKKQQIRSEHLNNKRKDTLKLVK